MAKDHEYIVAKSAPIPQMPEIEVNAKPDELILLVFKRSFLHINHRNIEFTYLFI